METNSFLRNSRSSAAMEDRGTPRSKISTAWLPMSLLAVLAALLLSPDLTALLSGQMSFAPPKPLQTVEDVPLGLLVLGEAVPESAVVSISSGGWGIAVKDCSECGRDALRSLLALYAKDAIEPLIVSSIQLADEVNSEAKASRCTLVASDEAVAKLCIWFCPRAFRLDHDGRLEWVQTEPTLASVQAEVKRWSEARAQ